MKKFFLLFLAIFLTTGCSFIKDDLENAQIYTTVYPIEYLTETLYGDYAKIDSIYPSGADISTYELTNKQIKKYAKSNLFIYNGLSDEKTIAKNLINENKNLLIIDVSYGLSYTYGIEELWMSPNNYLMLAKNIKDSLVENLSSKYIIENVEKKYDDLAVTLSLMDADLRSIGKEAKEKNANTLIVNDDLFNYLQNYGFDIISLDPDTVTETTINNVASAFKKKTYKTIILLDNKTSDAIDSIIKDNSANTIIISSMVDNEKDANDYITQMQSFIDSLRNLNVSD